MNERFNHEHLVEMVTVKSEVEKGDVRRVLQAMFDVVGHAVTDGDTVVVPNFGTWKTVTTRAQNRKNPQTGETFPVPEARRPAFRFAPVIKAAVKSGQAPDTFRKRSNGRGRI